MPHPTCEHCEDFDWCPLEDDCPVKDECIGGDGCEAKWHVWNCPRVAVFLFPGRFFSS